MKLDSNMLNQDASGLDNDMVSQEEIAPHADNSIIQVVTDNSFLAPTVIDEDAEGKQITETKQDQEPGDWEGNGQTFSPNKDKNAEASESSLVA